MKDYGFQVDPFHRSTYFNHRTSKNNGESDREGYGSGEGGPSPYSRELGLYRVRVQTDEGVILRQVGGKVLMEATPFTNSI